MIRFVLLIGAVALLSITSSACECAGPPTFCATLANPSSDPDIVVLGVKLDEVYYGMHVKVIGVFAGGVAVEDTITVWGDNGGLCRWYTGLWNNGDTVLWAFQFTDFIGNVVTAGFPPDLEQPGDYQISACGTYWLGYANGVVSGPLEPGVSSTSLVAFQNLVDGCLSTGITEMQATAPLMVREGEGGPWLSLNAEHRVHLIVADAMGCSCLARDWDGSPVQLSGMAPGIYLVQVQTDERRWVRKVVLQ